MKQYRNYVFDLYGTLVDIHTDEADARLWRILYELYRRYGIDHRSPADLRERFLKVEKALRKETADRLNTRFPEIKLERVFAALLAEDGARHSCAFSDGDPADGRDDPAFSGISPRDVWVRLLANTFRAASIKKIRLFPGVLPMLDRLTGRGARLYLLSNAQRVFTMPEIEYLGLASRFARLYLSSDYDFCKPEPGFLRRLLRDEGLDPAQTVMIGNEIKSDLAVADACGVDGILFNSWKLSEEEIAAQAGRPDVTVIGQWKELS